MRKSHSLGLLFAIAAIPFAMRPSAAQEKPCKGLFVDDALLPNYPPIAKAAHMEATYVFRVIVPYTGDAVVSLIDGPTKGVWEMLADNARKYVSSRKYGWVERSDEEPCSYQVSVEYRILPEQVDAPNNFRRVTVFDQTRTLVEVKKTTPTVNY